LSLVAALLAGVVVHAATPEELAAAVEARQTHMKGYGAALGVLGKMAQGEVAYDAAAAEAAKATLIATSMDIEAKFTVNAADPESKAKPEIWTNWADYLVKAKALTDAATALDTSSIETIGAGMGAIGGTCKDCHGAYQL
jgi:cytochrome c556